MDWNKSLSLNQKAYLEHKEYYQYRIRLLNRQLKSWIKFDTGNLTLLKTDLWNEAIDHDNASAFFSKRNIVFLGVDISRNITKRATLNFGRGTPETYQFLQSNIRNLPFTNKGMDIIFSLSTLDHLTPKQTVEALNEFRRILKSNGQAIITVDNVNYAWQRCLVSRIVRKFGLTNIVSRLTKRDLMVDYWPYTFWEFKALLWKAGLKIKAWTSISLAPNFMHGAILTNKKLLGFLGKIEQTKALRFFKHELVFYVVKAQ